MADGIKITSKGLDALLHKLRDAGKEIDEEVDAIFENTAKEFVGRAKRDAPKDVGFLAGEINYYRKGKLQYSIVSQSFYAGFLEFGTKQNYTPIPGYEDVAASIKGVKGEGSFEDFRKNIYAWTKRKGIQFKGMTVEETAERILISISVKGIKAQPYFFKQVEPAEAQLQKDLQTIVNILD